jgi:hypothetical protein
MVAYLCSVGIERDWQAVRHCGDETIIAADVVAELKALELDNRRSLGLLLVR